MKRRATFSLDPAVVAFLDAKAKAETGGNTSAYLERLVQQVALDESVRQHAAFFAERDRFFDDAEADRAA